MLNQLSRLLALTFFGLSTASVAFGLNILLTNDDSWASANIRFVQHVLAHVLASLSHYHRATHAALKAAGHDVLLVA